METRADRIFFGILGILITIVGVFFVDNGYPILTKDNHGTLAMLFHGSIKDPLAMLFFGSIEICLLIYLVFQAYSLTTEIFQKKKRRC